MDEKIKLELSSLPDAVNIMDIYRKVNRSYYEIGLLLMTAYNLMKKANIDSGRALKIGNDRNFFNNIMLYSNSTYKQSIEMCLIPVVEEHREEMIDIIDSVFELVNFEEKAEDEDWIKKVNELREKK